MFDVCAIVAPNPRMQAEFAGLIEARREARLYPRELDLQVLTDPATGRVGSDGGTLHALNQLQRRLAHDSRILLIHAGGESRRLPAYAPEGKLLQPVALASSSLYSPVLLDAVLDLFLRFPWRANELVVTSGDVALDFDTSLVSREQGEVCGFAAPATVEEGSLHGVYAFDRSRTVVREYYQKASAAVLRNSALLPGTDHSAVDIGIVSFADGGRERLRTLATEWQSELAGGELRFDLYRELLLAALGGVSWDDYAGRLQGVTALNQAQQERIYRTFADVSLRGQLVSKSRFLHFGMVDELAESQRRLSESELKPFFDMGEPELLPGVSATNVVLNSRNVSLPDNGMEPCLVENCEYLSVSALGGRNLLLGLRRAELSVTLPADTVLDQRRIALDSAEQEITAVYGTADTFRSVDHLKDLRFLGQDMQSWLEARGLEATDVWDDPSSPYDLLAARLYTNALSGDEIAYFWDANSVEPDVSERFRAARRFSLLELNDLTSPAQRDHERWELRRQILAEQTAEGQGWRRISSPDFASVAPRVPEKVLHRLATDTEDDLLRLYRQQTAKDAGLSFAGTAQGTLEIRYLTRDDLPALQARAVKQDQVVWARSPVRLDLAGGWTDTPPFTLREGGSVVNVAVDLNGQPPIQVFVRPTEEAVVRFHSIDLGISDQAESFENLDRFQDPDASFALPRAALHLLGLHQAAFPNSSLSEALQSLGGGFELTLLSAIPKGSGLGTSSILAATILSALHRYFGLSVTEDQLYRQVLQMEQLLTTGGGWQDQIGGVAGGVKYVTSRPGLSPRPVVYQLAPDLFEDSDSLRHFTLFYTGVTRLAKNILQEVVTEFNRMTPEYLFTVRRLNQLADAAHSAVALRDLEALGSIVADSWRANTLIHPSTSNDEIERLLDATREHFTGAKLLGAGGGGYMLFVSPSVEAAQTLRGILRREFENERARLVDMSLNRHGLQVSVS